MQAALVSTPTLQQPDAIGVHTASIHQTEPGSGFAPLLAMQPFACGIR